jgi:hypothetical protein
MNKTNFENKVTDLKRLLGLWKCRDLTSMGKITVIKTLALGRLQYIASFLTVPESVCNEINKSYL